MPGEDERFMSAALKLARRGRGSVEPNPMVGAIVVRSGREVSRGWHKEFGGPHAEIEALGAARSAGRRVRGATMYVTLEPCSHHGKTPPCTEAIIRAGLARVVVAMADPDENVSGGGIEALRRAGIEVATGVRQARGRELLAAYIKLRTAGRPWVICKWAQTADGYLALPPGEGRWISGPKSREYVHRLRGLCDGICVGLGTVLADDPLLTNRSGSPRQPTRIVLDSGLLIPHDCRLIRSAKSSPVIVATTSAAIDSRPDEASGLRRAGVELLALPAGEVGVDLPAMLEEFGRRQWTYLLVEGGTKVLESFIFSDLADELLTFVSPQQSSADWGGLPVFDIARLGEQLPLGKPRRRRFGDDVMLRHLLKSATP